MKATHDFLMLTPLQSGPLLKSRQDNKQGLFEVGGARGRAAASTGIAARRAAAVRAPVCAPLWYTRTRMYVHRVRAAQAFEYMTSRYSLEAEYNSKLRVASEAKRMAVRAGGFTAAVLRCSV